MLNMTHKFCQFCDTEYVTIVRFYHKESTMNGLQFIMYVERLVHNKLQNHLIMCTGSFCLGNAILLL